MEIRGSGIRDESWRNVHHVYAVVQFINGISNVLGLGKKPESAPEAPHAQDDGVKQPVYIPLALWYATAGKQFRPLCYPRGVVFLLAYRA
jgi:hypothetical protein